jgi:iron complex outermembrane recepter protein
LARKISVCRRLLASTALVGAAAFAPVDLVRAQAVQTAQADATPWTADAVPSPSRVPEVAAKPASVEEVVVTGSRIAQKGLLSPSPLTVIGQQEIELQGAIGVENLLNSFPQVFAAETTGVSSGSNGTATVNLRDLGAKHTLVLVDGKRLMPGDPSAPVPDLNNIPSQLVDRVEVITGGASAVYGSDAVAGVVNFIMKKNFQGVRLDVQGGFAQHTNGPDSSVDGALAALDTANPQNAVHVPGNVVDGRTIDVTAIVGANSPDDEGNVTAYAEYRNIQPVTAAEYSYSACSLSAVASNPAAPHDLDAHACAGSSNSQYGHFVVNSLANSAGQTILGSTTTAGLRALGVTTGALSDNPNGANAFVPYTSALAFNFGPYNYLQREDDRYTAGYFAHYTVNDHVDLYSDFMFADDHTVSQMAQSGLFSGAGANKSSTMQINCNNPLLSASQAQALCGQYAGTDDIANVNVGYRFVNGGPVRNSFLRHTDYKIDIGARGELAPGWSYDAYLQYGVANYTDESTGDASLTKEQNALLVNPDGTCMVGGDCVPLNIFSAKGLTSAALGYVNTPYFQSGGTGEQIASASVTGDLGRYGVRSPLAADGLGVAFGSEYRREATALNTDAEAQSGDLASVGGAIIGVSGAFDVYELFGEARLPIVQGEPFVQDLTLDGAYRFSNYSTAGRTDTYDGQFIWATTHDLTFRGGYSRAVRAPNVNELFAPQTLSNFGGSDPCASVGQAPTASLAQCERSGVTPAQYGNGTAGSGSILPCPAGLCSQLTGGNTNLRPETADTFTIGAVLTPALLKGFSLTVDWYDIKINGLISSGLGGANVTLTECLQTGAPVYCSMVHRDPSTGTVFGANGYVIATNVNTGFERTDGIDVQADYRLRPADWFSSLSGVGAFDVSLTGVYTLELIRQPVSGGGTFDCAGLYGSDHCNTDPIPHWRHRVRLTWNPPYPFTLSLAWRFIGGTQFDGDSSNSFLHQVNYDAIDARIPAYNYLDFSVIYRIRDGLVARMGVSNLTDKDPPAVDFNAVPAASAPLGNGNTFPGTYDSLGRTFFFGVTADL